MRPMLQRRARRRLWFPGLACLAAVLIAAEAADAAPSWRVGTIERSAVLNCPSVIGGFPYSEVGAMVDAEVHVDDSDLPKVGEVFYVRTVPAAIGQPCAGQHVAVELVPPAGVELAIGAQTPVVCGYADIDTGALTEIGPGEGCPQRPQAGVFGHAFNRSVGDPAWPLPYGKALIIQVPVRAQRPLKGAAGGTVSCPRAEGEPPCPAEQAGDNLQFAVHVLDGNASPWLSPHVPLFVEPAPGGTAPPPGGGSTPSPDGGSTPPGATSPAPVARLRVRAPRRLRVRRALRGAKVRVELPAAAAKVVAQLRGRLRGRRRRLIARAVRRDVAAGTLKLRLKPRRGAARALRRTRRVRAVLRMSVRLADGSRITARRRITIR